MDKATQEKKAESTFKDGDDEENNTSVANSDNRFPVLTTHEMIKRLENLSLWKNKLQG